MTEWKGKSKGTPLGYKIFILLIQKTGLGISYFLLHFVAFYFFLFSKKEKAHILHYFQEIHQFNYWKSQLYAYRNFNSFGISLLDKTAFLSGASSSLSFDFEGEKYLQKLAQEGQGAIIVGAHVGNWEIAGQLMDRINVRTNIIMKRNERAEIKDVLEKSEVLRKMNIIDVGDDFNYLFEIKSALDKNEFVILLGDRFIDGSKTSEYNFLGRKAKFPIGPFYLSVKFKKPVIFTFATKESRKHYHFYASEPIYNTSRVPANNINERIDFLIEEYIKNLERIVLKYPEQWYNFYKFWE
ncbi:LpxL/LpxP family acyltransferase [Maribellus mangrovi]|uniref:LpxL/LpxP family acyltransferase n=1 Tax=Maribellus mangrovi TaxID=3133146 RepID=UPI0030EE7E8C